MVAYLVNKFFQIIILLMLIRVLLSWIPNINWNKEPVYSLRKFTDIIFEPFRRIIPPLGMFDVSAIVAFFAVEIVRNFVVILLYNLGI